MFWLGAAVALNTCLWTRGGRYRLLAQYALGAAALFVFGLVLAYVGPTSMLRFYWFRFGDTMLPLLGWFALAMILSDASRALTGHLKSRWRPVGALCAE